MNGPVKPLRIFVAMPGTELGKKSRYGDPTSVKKNLFDVVVKRLKKELRRPVTLVIEKDKPTTTPDIPSSMFSEAADADIYFADLTNANPNVYLELGVRWALRDGLTIPIYQNEEDLRFNVHKSRAFQYTPDNINDTINTFVEMIKKYVESRWNDSPVRDGAKFISIRKTELEDLKKENRRLQEERGEELFKAAMAEKNTDRRIELLERTVAANPAYADAHFELGIAYRKSSAYDKSAEQLEKAVELEGGNARYCRELGVTYSKSHRIGEAINHLKRAVDLDPKDREAWSNLGGALRRDGTRNAPGEFDVPVLKEARECYNRAAQLDKYDLYAALNVCRLDLLLATWEPNKFQEAIKGFADRLPLCQYQAQLDPDDAWRQFDLAEALLFAGSKAEAKEAFIKAIKSTPSAEQQSIFGSVREPLAGYLISDGIPPKTKNKFVRFWSFSIIKLMGNRLPLTVTPPRRYRQA